MTHNCRIDRLAVLVCALLVSPAPALAQDSDRFGIDASLYVFMAGLSGDIMAAGVPAKIDASFGDLVDHMEMNLAGELRASRGPWALATEISYLQLNGSTGSASVEIEQWLVEPSLNYWVRKDAEAFVGVRYNSISGDVSVDDPLDNDTSDTGTQAWWDPIVGAQLALPPFNEQLTLRFHFDVGGFGIGSDFTWQAFPFLDWRFAEWNSAQFGYRWLGTDYDSGSGSSEFGYDTITQGAQLALAAHF